MARLEFLRSALGSAVGVAGGKLGSDVTVVGTQSSILPPYDEELTKPVAASLRKLGVQVLLDSKVQCLNAAGDAVRVQDAAGRESELAADQVLVAIGRVPHTHGWGPRHQGLRPVPHIDAQCLGDW